MTRLTLGRAVLLSAASLVGAGALWIGSIAINAAAAPAPVLLWPNGAPGAQGTTDQDQPAILPYLPSAATNTGAAVLVIPGGGFTKLNAEKEGAEVATWLNSQGIAAFVLRYRLMPRYPKDSAVADTNRAIQHI